MPIRYHLVENRLTANPNDYYALVEPIGSLDLDGVAARMVAAGSTVTEADIRAVFTDFVAQVKSALTEGYRVNIGDLANLYPSISGVFEGLEDRFDPTRHTLNLNANAARGAITALREHAHTEKTEATLPMPVLLSFVDLGSGTSNATATPGNIGTLNGSRLKFNPAAEEADEGVFFINTTDGTATQASIVQKNVPKQLVFLVPALPSGSYRLEVRTRFNRNKDLRTGSLDKVLTVT